jgi:hypothetical protein
LPDLPGDGQGKTIKGRHQFEANKSSEEYLKAMQTDPQYEKEQGFNLETWLVLAINTLHTKNIQIDDWQGQGKISLLTGSYFKSFINLPFADWTRGNRRAVLSRGLGWFPNPNYSTRSLVEIPPLRNK